MSPGRPPILRHKDANARSVFRAENLLREARRQKGIDTAAIPPVCLLDPDGDMLRYLKKAGEARPCAAWSCYHSDMFEFDRAGVTIGIVACAVGAPFAVLLAEQMRASGCRLLVSITSSGQLAPIAAPPYYVLIERALRDEGTSYHYQPPAEYAAADPDLLDRAARILSAAGIDAHRGATWTTDAPFRETEGVITQGKALGLAAIEMESAALYAFAAASATPILCFAHVTNTMAVDPGDFEKGAEQGAVDSLRLVEALLSEGVEALLGAG